MLTEDEELAQVMRSVRVHGEGRDKYDCVRIGLNGRLDTIQAAVLIEKLKIFRDEIEARNRVAARYSQTLSEVAMVSAAAAIVNAVHHAPGPPHPPHARSGSSICGKRVADNAEPTTAAVFP